MRVTRRETDRQTDGQKNCDTINARKANRKLRTNPIGKVVEEGTRGGELEVDWRRVLIGKRWRLVWKPL